MKTGIASLRVSLRDATRVQHDRLDHAMAGWPVHSRSSYILFLALQYAARKPLEEALAARPPDGISAPPRQTELLLADLRELDARPPAPGGPIALADGDAALGAAWVLAGSSLGNRYLARQRREAGLDEAMRFLTDAQLSTYFKTLLTLLDMPLPPARRDRAVTGAQSAFAAFAQGLDELAQDPVR